MANNYVEPLFCWFRNSCSCLGKEKKKQKNNNNNNKKKCTQQTNNEKKITEKKRKGVHNYSDPARISGVFGLNFKISNAWGDLSVWPENESVGISDPWLSTSGTAIPTPARAVGAGASWKQAGVALETAAVWG